MTTPLAFIAARTTGRHADRKVWEFAAVRREADGSERARRLFVRNVDLATAEPMHLRDVNFYGRHPQYCPPADVPTPASSRPAEQALERLTAAREIEGLLRCATVVSVAPAGDLEVLSKMLRGVGLAPSWLDYPIDVTSLAAGWLVGHGHGLDFDRPFEPGEVAGMSGQLLPLPSDDALGEARWVEAWFDTINGRGDCPSCSKLEQYRRDLTRPGSVVELVPAEDRASVDALRRMGERARIAAAGASHRAR